MIWFGIGILISTLSYILVRAYMNQEDSRDIPPSNPEPRVPTEKEEAADRLVNRLIEGREFFLAMEQEPLLLSLCLEDYRLLYHASERPGKTWINSFDNEYTGLFMGYPVIVSEETRWITGHEAWDYVTNADQIRKNR